MYDIILDDGANIALLINLKYACGALKANLNISLFKKITIYN